MRVGFPFSGVRIVTSSERQERAVLVIHSFQAGVSKRPYEISAGTQVRQPVLNI